MSDTISPDQFSASEGVADWQAEEGSAAAEFRTGSFAAGVRFVDAIGEIADGVDHHPDVDLRYATVTVRTSSHDVDGLSERDVDLARRISDAARELEIPAAPSR
ncbi:4a-hydroxytetrahydrobiopterin dehydratase [Isoptericola sp. NEAU-Y5]|uniref:Putative pterin-4-alpha-carbinolamine dehydratase n=1 Tax=Isoptericola luteus TaxID=2879484 RepID=A0ABS7ZLN5_9MICO|nr:4a-hydroxytetrahydrobiopterin dehydratase [Isoptericola sp. NEAU-Y5]MCA5894784.1 4a-hydroxytetrahydrobiopterin dehydratase [Isoptericola sp. NEAU-Y5]